jgi:hypothetical protein
MQLPRSIHATKRAAEECAYPDEEPVRYIPAPPTKPEVVDGEVTPEQRGAAAVIIDELERIADAGAVWSQVQEQLAEALRDAEARGFAAGRASVTAVDGDEYASPSVWAELRGLYEIAKKAWAVRTCESPDAPGELDEALDFYANVAHPAHLARIVKPVPYPAGRASVTAKAEGWKSLTGPCGVINVDEAQTCLFAIQVSTNGAPLRWEYFVDAVVWDAETDPDWSDGDHGWSLDDGIWFKPIGAPPAPADTELKGET